MPVAIRYDKIEEVPEMNMPEFEGSNVYTVMVQAAGGEAQAANPNDRAKTYFQQSQANYGMNKTEYRNLVKLCREIAKDEGIVATFIDLHLDLNALGTENKFKREVDERYRMAFNGFAAGVNKGIPFKEAGLDAFQRKFAWEYWISGLVVTLEYVAPMRMGAKAGKRVSYKVPVELDILDPLRVDLDNLYITSEVFYELDEKQIKDIKDNGLNAQWIQIYDKSVTKVKPTPTNLNPYQPKSQADIVDLVVNKRLTSVPLPMAKVRMVRRSYDDYSVYPLPFLARILVSLADKAMLREADRSVLSKLINQILTYKVGQYNQQGQATNVGDKVLQKAATSFASTLSQSKDGRIMVCFIADTHKLEWVSPNTSALLDENKYATANLELIAALIGLPAWSLIATGGSGVDFELLMKVVSSQHDTFLNIYKRFVETIYAEIVDWNGMRFDPGSVNLKQKRISIFDTAAYTTFVSKLADKNWVSVQTAVEEAGFDFETEIENLIKERDLRKQEKILVAVPTFSQTSTTNNGQTKTTNSQPSPGRPTGATDQQPRQPNDPNAVTNPPIK